MVPHLEQRRELGRVLCFHDLRCDLTLVAEPFAKGWIMIRIGNQTRTFVAQVERLMLRFSGCTVDHTRMRQRIVGFECTFQRKKRSRRLRGVGIV